jgi:hypothetical protein
MESSVQFQNASYFTLINEEIMEDYNIFRDVYYIELMNYTELYTMSQEEFLKYRYQPKRLSYDLYKTVDYWYILLIINTMTSRMDFKKRIIRALTQEGLGYVKRIAKKEEYNISKNKNTIVKELAEIHKYT